MYNLVKRQAEVEILPLAESECLGVISYSPLAAGLLTGKYSADVKAGAGRIVEKDQYARRYSDPSYYEIAGRFTQLAQELGVKPATLALGWVKSHPAITAPIIGARNVAQLQDSMAAADMTMDADLRERISRLSIAPGTATDRLEEALDDKFKLRNR